MNNLLPPENGACKGKPTEWWFPLRSDGNIAQQRINRREAISICFMCKGRIQCLEYSLRNEPFGIWGGLDEAQREELRRQREVPCRRTGSITIPGTGSRKVISVHAHE